MLEKIKESITYISEDLTHLQDPFWVVGSSALVLAGIQLESIDDIDLLTSNRDADFLKQLWQNNKLEAYSPAHGDKFLSNFGRFRFGEILIEVMGELKVFHENKWQILRINDWQEVVINEKLSVKIPTLAEQYRIFKLFGREKDLKKANLILQQTTYIQPSNGN
ncbi:hypothetical protein GCM10011514_39310 [Emticicia aquatilis]|uniref:Nucleotidyltransferase family protein n=1 Tax=Emticicia aquatilis TaxID=1537369 RepID=A0A917DVP9_9BACT|nr:hypothetical protein [Emticicia aquatilis]GGD71371.1 hypothetical protein GCM10011514_39310 [Emticicia aquatilis]